ncbi:protein of unknown function [Taphrina deformans PYCC 5710]|uniref:Uncharacterized protein n=1 Tax=Taphrina deformans (strain PYCC 5710 / ATCC 11124 / CBS 356.35 / IMI 108563 / JCM 9778 / NBRC 8474) TaxID=1097556 RepID=R4XH78_TAPDE|nr:protein of unknown function [Taphrina deformans PYCC 5710]|eukprot:CCG83883.1 protein of unknown function [Taphrina deformans PYCC 5710]
MEALMDSFKCQYHQLVPARNFSLARKEQVHLLTHSDYQDRIEPILFPSDVTLAVPETYRKSIVKLLIRALEQMQVEVSEVLLEYYTSVTVQHGGPSNTTQRHVGVVEPPSSAEVVPVRYFYRPDKSFQVYESPSVLVAQGTTGHKTWEAALALGDLLLAQPELLASQSVLELGAGTGFLSLLSSKLGASHVVSTDGSERMVELMQSNVTTNREQDKISCKKLWFGEGNELEMMPFDVILGADVTYDESVLESLCKTLKRLLTSNPMARVMIAATVRRQATYVRVAVPAAVLMC